MTATSQHEFHPDAEKLSAFAEQALGERECAEVLAHLAACGRCRRVVTLARDAADADIGSQRVTAREPRAWWRSWWIAAAPAAALAATVAVVVYVHVRNVERSAEVARVEPQGQAPSAASVPAATQQVPEEAAPAASPPSETPPARLKSPAQSSAAPGPAERRPGTHTEAPPPYMAAREGRAGKAPSVAEEQAQANRLTTPSERSDSRAEVHGMEFGLRHSPPTAAPPPAPLPPPPAAEGAISGGVRDVEKEAAEPAMHAAQEQAERQRQAEASNGRLLAPRAGAVSGTAGAQASAPAASASPPGPSPQIAVPRLVPTRPAAMAAKSIHLPSGLDAMSMAGAGHRELAIDQAGTLFVSEDWGDTWERVDPQWTGRAVQVRRRLVADGALQSAPAAQAEPEGNVPAEGGPVQPPVVFFELLNDKNQIWLSTDGKTWTAQ